MANPGQISVHDSRFAGVVVDGAGNEFHLVNTAGSNYRYGIKRLSDGAIVYHIPGDKHSAGALALRADGAIIASIGVLDPATGKYPISHFTVAGVAVPPVSGGGGGGTSGVDQTARNAAAAAQQTANEALAAASSAQSTANGAKNTANDAKNTASSAQSTANAARDAANAAQAAVNQLRADVPGIAWQKALDALFWIADSPEGQASDAGKAYQRLINSHVAWIVSTPEGRQSPAGVALTAFIDARIALGGGRPFIGDDDTGDPDDPQGRA